MYERFTSEARRVVVLAQEEARLIGHNYIGTEHLLLGLLHQNEGVAAKALGSLGITLENVRLQVKDIIGEGGSPPSGHIPFTPKAKNTFELSLDSTLFLGTNHIDTEHLLLGLIGQHECVAYQILIGLDIDLEQLRAIVVEMAETTNEPARIQRAIAVRNSLVNLLAQMEELTTDIESEVSNLLAKSKLISNNDMKRALDWFNGQPSDHPIAPIMAIFLRSTEAESG